MIHDKISIDSLLTDVAINPVCRVLVDEERDWRVELFVDVGFALFGGLNWSKGGTMSITVNAHQMIGRFLEVFEEQREKSGQIEMEDVMHIGIDLFDMLQDAFDRSQQLMREQERTPGESNCDGRMLVKECIALFKRLCHSFQQFELEISRLRDEGDAVAGAERFIGCIREAERIILRWENDQKKAMEIRATWMRAQGVPEEEIAEHCDPMAYPANLCEEEMNLRALDTVVQMPIAEELWSKHISRNVQSFHA